MRSGKLQAFCREVCAIDPETGRRSGYVKVLIGNTARTATAIVEHLETVDMGGDELERTIERRVSRAAGSGRQVWCEWYATGTSKRGDYCRLLAPEADDEADEEPGDIVGGLASTLRKLATGYAVLYRDERDRNDQLCRENSDQRFELGHLAAQIEAGDSADEQPMRDLALAMIPALIPPLLAKLGGGGAKPAPPQAEQVDQAEIEQVEIDPVEIDPVEIDPVEIGVQLAEGLAEVIGAHPDLVHDDRVGPAMAALVGAYMTAIGIGPETEK